MKKFKRILSAILIAAMALSLMPAFASAEVGDTYTYVFNPKQLVINTAYTESDYTSYEKTVVNSSGEAITGAAPWAFNCKYNVSSWKSVATGSYYWMQVGGATNTEMFWFAFNVKIPTAGTYSLALDYRGSANSGNINIFSLPIDTTLSSSASQTFEGADALASNISLNASSDVNDAKTDLTGTITTSSPNEERIIVVQSNGFAPDKKFNIIYLESLTLTKTEEAEDDTTVKHTVTFNANNGTDATTTQSVVTETATALTANSFTKEGYVFSGWNTQADGKGTAYADKAEVTLTDDLTLYAQWKLAPITLTFDKTTVESDSTSTTIKLKAKDGQNFSIVQTSSDADLDDSSIQLYGILVNRVNNWLPVSETNANKGKLTIRANNIPAGTYKISAKVKNFNRGSGVYFYVDEKYVGYDESYISGTDTYATAEVNEETIGYVTVTDTDENDSTDNAVDIVICGASAARQEANLAYLYVLNTITFEAVDAIPAYGELNCTVDGSAAEASYSVENGATLSVSAMLSGKHLNGYKLDGTKDTDNYIKVSSSDESIVSVKDTEAALTSAEIYASGYKPVYSLVAKAGGTAIITVEAIVDGKSVASKTFTVEVEKLDIDEYDPEAVFAWGTTLPDALKDNVTVTEKGGESINAGEITASKGTTYELSVTPEIIDGETTYKFIGWKRGATSDGAAAFTEYEASAEYTVWSNTYLTAVYEEITSTGEKRVEFYDQDGYYLGYKTGQDLKENGLPSSNPKLLGHTFSKWQYVENGETKEFTKDTELTEAVTRVVALQNPSEVTITYQDENGNETAQKTYGYNAVVNAAKDCGISNVEYWRWVVGSEEKTVRTDAGYTFYAWADAILKAYTVSETETTPKVVLHGTNVDGSYMIEYDRFSGTYTVVEAGILLGNTDSISLLSCDKKYTSAKGGKSHGQYAAPHENYNYVRGYIIYKTNSTGALSVVYTDTAATGK